MENLGLKDEIEGLRAENVKLREQLEEACARAPIPEKPPVFELETSPISN
jgi:hypothetical protein